MNAMTNPFRTLGKLGLAWLLAAAGPCGGEAPPPAAEPVPPLVAATPPEAATTPVPGPGATPMDNYQRATQIVDRLEKLPQLSKASLERLLGVSMVHVPAARAQDLYYEATLASGPLSRVEVRNSNPSQNPFALVILDVRSGEQIPLSRFRSEGRVTPDMHVDVNPDVPPEGTITFSKQVQSQTVRYEFRTKSQILSGMMVERRPSP